MLVELTERFRQGIKGKIKDSFFLDLKKAFDTFDHKVLFEN